MIQLKRDRKILNKAELTRLQRNFEACVSEIQTLHGRKTSVASVCSLILGVIGAAFMAGSTFAVTAQPPHYIFMHPACHTGISGLDTSVFSL